jgi:predicted PurR-regulated permease PerM
MALTVLAAFFCYRVVQPFLSALLWAVALAVLANPFYRWLARKLPFRSLAAAVSVAVVVLVLVLPTVVLAPRLASDAAAAVNSVSESLEGGRWRDHVAQIKAVAGLVSWIESNVDLAEVARESARMLTTGLSSLVKGSVTGIMQLLVSAFLLFYLFRDQHKALAALRSLLPISSGEADLLFSRFGDTIHAIIFGKMLTATAQGTIAGIGFWILGLPAPWFWGLVMGVLSFLPFVGASFVWAPVAFFIALDGHLGRAFLLVVWGVVLVAPIEVFLYPMMLGHRLRLHNALVFLAVVGGLFSFGPVGLVVGPSILALTLGLQDLWQERAAAASPHPPSESRPALNSQKPLVKPTNPV